MKFLIVLVSCLIWIMKSIKFEKSKTLINPYIQDYLPQIKFTPGNQIVDITLVTKIHSTVLYETWDVLKQEAHSRKPLVAHIFKYTLSSVFPMKPDNLNLFCEKILAYNHKMQSLSTNIRALPCYNSTVNNQRIPGGVVSYVLFERPLGGAKLIDMCTPNCSKERICKYMIKDFIKGFIESIKYVQASTEPFDVNFVLAQNGFFFGRSPSVKKELNETAATIVNILAHQKIKSENEDDVEDKNRHFITLAYPKAYSPETVLSGGAKNITGKLLDIKNKQLMVQLGKFLIDMYKGFDNTTNIPVPLPDDDFNPRQFRFKNFTDVYLILNTDEEGNYTKFRQDEYFGITPQLASGVKAFLDKSLTNKRALKDLNFLLRDSFFEFIFKSTMFDVDSKIQFDKLDTMLAHKFVTKKIEVNRLKSDTGYEK